MPSTTPDEELVACPFCAQTRVKMLVDNEEWCIARVGCQAHRCGALGPWVELSEFETVADARAKAAELWNAVAATPLASLQEQLARKDAKNERLTIDCEFLLSVIDSCDEAEAPSDEMEPEDVANIARIRKAVGYPKFQPPSGKAEVCDQCDPPGSGKECRGGPCASCNGSGRRPSGKEATDE